MANLPAINGGGDCRVEGAQQPAGSYKGADGSQIVGQIFKRNWYRFPGSPKRSGYPPGSQLAWGKGLKAKPIAGQGRKTVDLTVITGLPGINKCKPSFAWSAAGAHNLLRIRSLAGYPTQPLARPL
jgi:hypothetical protein